MLLNRFWQAMLCFHLTMMAIGRLATEKPGMRPLNLSKHARTHPSLPCGPEITQRGAPLFEPSALYYLSASHIRWWCRCC